MYSNLELEQASAVALQVTSNLAAQQVGLLAAQLPAQRGAAQPERLRDPLPGFRPLCALLAWASRAGRSGFRAWPSSSPLAARRAPVFFSSNS